MIERHLYPLVQEALTDFPAVALLGPRQAGKTTLAHQVREQQKNSLYLDLESPNDRQRLTAPEAYLSLHENHLVILDEVQQMPALFQVLLDVTMRTKLIRFEHDPADGEEHGRYDQACPFQISHRSHCESQAEINPYDSNGARKSGHALDDAAQISFGCLSHIFMANVSVQTEARSRR